VIIRFVGDALPCQVFCKVSSFDVIFETEETRVESMDNIPRLIDWERFSDA
jgi:hypothetical protein